MTEKSDRAQSENESRNAFLLRLSDVLYSLSDPVEIQAAAARCIGEHVRANRVFYIDIIDGNEAMIHRDFVNGVASLAGRQAAECFGGETMASLSRGESLMVNDVRSDPGLSDAGRAALEGAQVTSCIVVSLVKDGRWVAALGAHSITPGAWAMSDISLLQETAERTWSAVVRTRTEQAVRASLAEKDALLRGVHHRVKNNLQLIMSLINLQASQIEDKRVLALFDATRNRIHSIATVHETLHRSLECTHLDMAAYARQLVPELMRLHGIDERIQVRVDTDSDALELERAVPFGLLFNELVANACKHAFPGKSCGEVSIRCGRDNDCYFLIVCDNGVGLPLDLDYHHAGSLGLKLVHMLAQQLGGNVVVTPGSGAHIEVRFPAVRARQEGNV